MFTKVKKCGIIKSIKENVLKRGGYYEKKY